MTHRLRADGFDAREDGTGRGTPLVAFDPTAGSHNMRAYADGTAPGLKGGTGLDIGWVPAVAFDASQSDVIPYGDQAGPLDIDGHSIAVAFHENQRAELTLNDTAGSLKVGGGKPGQGYPAIQAGMAVRRLTPRECERLMGFEDDYTAIPYRGKPASDGPRYKALGNAMAVPVVRWIGQRIQLVDAIA